MFTQDEKCLEWTKKYIVHRSYLNFDWEQEEDVLNHPCIFDIGHNTGEFTRHVFNVLGDKVNVFAFEANPNVCSDFINSKNVSINHVAVSDQQGTSTLFIPTQLNETKSSSHLSSLSERPCYKILPQTYINQIEVELISLDYFYKENSLKYIDYLKIDTEGYELEVLKGCNNLLKSQLISCGQFEVGDTFKERGYSIKVVVQLLHNFEYYCFIGPVKKENLLTVENCEELFRVRSNDMWENIIFINRHFL